MERICRMEVLEEQHNALTTLFELGMLNAADVKRIVSLQLADDRPIDLEVIDLLDGELLVSDRLVAWKELPIRSSSLRLVTVISEVRDAGSARPLLFEVNRVLVEGGILLLRSGFTREELPRILLSVGFALSDPQAVSGFSVGVKVWKSYLKNRCPRCGSELAIPLIPEDSTSIRIWSFYCSSCGYVWNSEEPVLRLTF